MYDFCDLALQCDGVAVLSNCLTLNFARGILETVGSSVAFWH